VVGVDGVGVLGGVGLGRAEAFGEADEDHADGGADEFEPVCRRDRGRAESGQAGVDVPDDVHALAVKAEDGDRGDA